MHILTEREHLLFTTIYNRSLPDGTWNAIEVSGFIPGEIAPVEWDNKKFLLSREASPDEALDKDHYKTTRRDGEYIYFSVDSATIKIEHSTAETSVIIPSRHYNYKYELVGNEYSYCNMICFKPDLEVEDLDMPEKYRARFEKGKKGSLDALMSIAESADIDPYNLLTTSLSDLSKVKMYHITNYRKGDFDALSDILFRKVYFQLWKKMQKSS